MKERIKHDAAVSSVIGEMIMIALVIILVALFASSAFSLIPGERDLTVDIVMKPDNESITFWHKGGDWVQKKDLSVIILKQGGTVREEYLPSSITDIRGNNTMTFDLGGKMVVLLDLNFEKGDLVRVATPGNIIYSGVI